ncbi:MAG: hybrid sensor histidine kinase/response regulator, partial [Allosphingosinicella sp.]
MASTARIPAAGLTAVAAAAAASAALMLWAVGSLAFAAAFLAGALALGVPLALGGGRKVSAALPEPALDRALLRAALDASTAPVALTDLNGALCAANAAYEQAYNAASPAGLAEGVLEAARRDGEAEIVAAGRRVRAALAGDRLVWRLERIDATDVEGEARRLVLGEAGDRLGQAGIMAALVDAEGRLLGANRAF